MRFATGVITIVQEQRFQLATHDGPPRLFVLARQAALEAADLQVFRQAGKSVTVRYDDVPDVLAHVAHDVREEPVPCVSSPSMP